MIRTYFICMFVLVLMGFSSCRTRKTGCPQPRSNWGAEKILDEMQGKHHKKNRH